MVKRKELYYGLFVLQTVSDIWWVVLILEITLFENPEQSETKEINTVQIYLLILEKNGKVEILDCDDQTRPCIYNF